jgi:methionyl-tRNA formyltransferase
MRAIFMGTPALAIPSLDAAFSVSDLVGVITQPAKRKGRGLKKNDSPIAIRAKELGIETYVPESIRTPAFQDTIRQLEPDIAIVVAYGKILPAELLNIPGLGCVNIHASLLPELRGAGPIQWAIARGYVETGVTLMQMDEGMDTGPIHFQKKTDIKPHETAIELGDRLSVLGAQLITEGLPALERGMLIPVDQDDSRATYAPLLTKADGMIDWKLTATQIINRLRGFKPWPGAYTYRSDKAVHVTVASALEQDDGSSASTLPGTVLAVGNNGISVACNNSSLLIERLKPEGSREMSVAEFLSGYKLVVGEVFG